MLEVCIDSLESAINAIHGGADELEVCSSLPEGGLTPSVGLVKKILNMVKKVPGDKIYKTCTSCSCVRLKKRPKVNVMIRCRPGSDFHYTDLETDTMLADIAIFKEMGVDRFVFGALTSKMTIDEDTCVKVIGRAAPLPVTFHRAFDVCRNIDRSIEQIIDLGFDRLLTSGQKETAEMSLDVLKSLFEVYNKKITIMPGAGINVDNVKMFIDSGFDIVHSSCKSTKIMPFIKNDLGLGNSNILYVTQENTVSRIKQLLVLES